MSTPEGPDRPWEADPTAPPREQYSEPPFQSYDQPQYQQQPQAPQQPPNQQGQPYPQQPYDQPPYDQGPPPYPGSQQGPQQQGPPQHVGSEQYGAQQYPPQPQQYGPAAYQQPPGPGPLPPYSAPYGEQNYGAPHYGYPQTAAYEKSGNRTPLIITAIAVLVVALAVIGIVVLTGGDDKKPAAQTPPPTDTVPVSTSTAPDPTSGSASSGAPASGAPPTSVAQITVPSVISGWHGVLSYKESVAYDVPPDWKIETPGTLVGFEDSKGQPIAIMHGVSTYKDDACPSVSGSYRGHTGFKTAGNLSPETAAHSGLETFAQGVALRDNGSFAPISRSPMSDITVDQGKIKAKYERATVTLNDKSDCGSPTVVVVAVAFRTSSSTTALFIGYFDQGVSDALPLSTLTKILTTLRPYTR